MDTEARPGLPDRLRRTARHWTESTGEEWSEDRIVDLAYRRLSPDVWLTSYPDLTIEHRLDYALQAALGEGMKNPGGYLCVRFKRFLDRFEAEAGRKPSHQGEQYAVHHGTIRRWRNTICLYRLLDRNLHVRDGEEVMYSTGDGLRKGKGRPVPSTPYPSDGQQYVLDVDAIPPRMEVADPYSGEDPGPPSMPTPRRRAGHRRWTTAVSPGGVAHYQGSRRPKRKRTAISPTDPPASRRRRRGWQTPYPVPMAGPSPETRAAIDATLKRAKQTLRGAVTTTRELTSLITELGELKESTT